jgi:hypothetical protein
MPHGEAWQIRTARAEPAQPCVRDGGRPASRHVDGPRPPFDARRGLRHAPTGAQRCPGGGTLPGAAGSTSWMFAIIP